MAYRHGATSGRRPTREYRVWQNMLTRCFNVNNRAYPDYGGRGITVCGRWTNSNGFQNFLTDMGPCPPGLTLDRRNNDLSYDPDNCRWASRSVQNKNRRKFTHSGAGVRYENLLTESERLLRKKARAFINNRIQKGTIERQPCEEPGCPDKAEAHHHKGYARENWQEVRWLCKTHHSEAESVLKAGH